MRPLLERSVLNRSLLLREQCKPTKAEMDKLSRMLAERAEKAKRSAKARKATRADQNAKVARESFVCRGKRQA